MKDGVAGAAALKPDIAGVKGLQDGDTIKAAGLYWRPPNLDAYKLLIPVDRDQERLAKLGSSSRDVCTLPL